MNTPNSATKGPATPLPATPTSAVFTPGGHSYMNNPFLNVIRTGSHGIPAQFGNGSVLTQLSAQHRILGAPNPYNPPANVFQSQPIKSHANAFQNTQQQHQWMLQHNHAYFMNNLINETQGTTEPNFEPFEKQSKQIRHLYRQAKLKQLRQFQEQLNSQSIQLEAEDDEEQQLINIQQQQALIEQEEKNDVEEQEKQDSSWFTCLQQESLKRYSQNAKYVNEIFFGELPNPVPNKDYEAINSQIRDQVKKLDDEIQKMESDLQERLEDIVKKAETFKTLHDQVKNARSSEEFERCKRKYEQLYHKDDESLQRSNKKTRTARISDDTLFP
ncbi:skp, partial [Acrasis kona]